MRLFYSFIFGTMIMMSTTYSQSQNTDTSSTIMTRWSGYLKQMQTTIYQPALGSVLLDGLLQQRINFSLYGNQSAWSFHAELRNRMFYGNFFELNPAMGDNIHDLNNDYLPLSLNIIDKDQLLVNSYFDRLYAQWTHHQWEIRLGRQRINWGISTFWNPNDLFNSFDFTDFDYEERPGSDALRLTWYTGPVSRLEGAIKIADSWNEVTGAFLYRWNAGSFDFQVIGGKYREDIAAGGGWSGYINDIGFKGEFMFFQKTSRAAKSIFNATAGIDYLFGNNLSANVGYLYNEAGSTGSGPSIFSFQLSSKNLYPYRHALYAGGNYLFTPLFTGGISAVYSPVKSHPLFITPNVTYNVAQNWDLDLVSQMFISEPATGQPDLDVFAFFLRLKWNF